MKQEWLKISADAKTNTTTIDIEGTIGGDWWSDIPAEQQATKENVKKALKEIASVKGDKLIININSLGGDVNHGLSIHDLLAQNPAHKTVNINGMTASAATVIAMAGDVIKMSDNALFLVHRASTIVWGNAEEMKQMIEDLIKIDNVLAKIYAKRSGKTVDEILAQMDKGVTGEWMTAEEAKEFGFIDKVFEPTKMAAAFDTKFLAKAGLPEIPNNKLTKTKIEMPETKIENKESTFLDGFVAKIKSAFAEDKSEAKTEEQIDAKIKTIAEAEATKLTSDFDAKIDAINTENEKAKNDLVAKHNEELKAKSDLVDVLNADKSKLASELKAAQDEIDTLKGVETEGAGDSKASEKLKVEGSKTKLTGNAKAAEQNAAALRGEIVEDEDEDEEA